jgi:uncharacterized protein (TIGR02246 family)
MAMGTSLATRRLAVTKSRASVRYVSQFLGLALCLVLPGTNSRAKQECKASLTEQDVASIKAVIETYRTTWLAGDTEGVLNTLTEDAVLLPPHAGSPVVGRAAIRQYWWPDGAKPAKITKLNISVEQVGGDSTIGYARGRDEVAWSAEDNGTMKDYAVAGIYLNVMRKLPDGSWRVSHHMWDNVVNQK